MLLVLLWLFFIPSRMYAIAARHGAQEEQCSGNDADTLAGTENERIVFAWVQAECVNMSGWV